MELSKLSVDFIEGYEGHQWQDGYTQKDKTLPYLTVVYPRQGYFEVALEDDEYVTLSPNEGCFITAPDVRHTIVHRIDPTQEQLCDRWLMLSVSYDHAADVTGWFEPPLLVKGEQGDAFCRVIDELYELCCARRDGRVDEHGYTFQRLRLAGTVLELLLDVCRFHPRPLEQERLYPAIVKIRNEYGRGLTVDELAAACNMSGPTFHRLFRQTMNKTPLQYLNEYRLRQAERLWLSTDRPLAAIAALCGFYDEFHLSRNFKALYGLSPREYKRQTL